MLRNADQKDLAFQLIRKGPLYYIQIKNVNDPKSGQIMPVVPGYMPKGHNGSP